MIPAQTDVCAAEAQCPGQNTLLWLPALQGDSLKCKTCMHRCCSHSTCYPTECYHSLCATCGDVHTHPCLQLHNGAPLQGWSCAAEQMGTECMRRSMTLCLPCREISLAAEKVGGDAARLHAPLPELESGELQLPTGAGTGCLRGGVALDFACEVILVRCCNNPKVTVVLPVGA